MFTIERIKVKSNDCDNYWQEPANCAAKALVKAQGKYKIVGSGCYGAVYGAKGSDIVYKIGDATDNDGYLAYVKQLSKQKTHNKFTPKIHGVRVYESKHDKYFVVAMERLSPLKREHHSLVDWFAEAFMNDNFKTMFRKELGIIVPKPLKELYELLVDSYTNGRNVDWDLHSGNFMMRGDQIVIIDPLA